MKIRNIFAVTALVMLTSSIALAQTTTFTYQGSLQNAGSPANGNFDFEVSLWNGLTGGNQLGTNTRTNISVANGVYTLELDFGSEAFNWAETWLQISIRPSGNGSYTLLTPRAQVRRQPLAIRSSFASTAQNALQLGGYFANLFAFTDDPRFTNQRAPTAGSPNYIHNSTTAQPLSNFNIDGSGTVGGVLNAGSVTTFSINSSGLISGGLVNSTGGYQIGGATALRMGNCNTYTGNQAGLFAGGSCNSFYGQNAGRQSSTGNDNSFFGAGAGYLNDAGNENSFFGYLSGNNSQGNRNAFFGWRAGLGNGAGNSNTLIGYNTQTIGTLNNATALGNQALVTQSNSLVLGSIAGVNDAAASTNVGVGTTAPNFRMHVRASGQDGIKIQHTGVGAYPQIRFTDAADVFKASIGVDTSGTGSLNMFVNGADRMILKSNGVVQVPGPIVINNPNTLIITSPNGACWGITVGNTGTLATFPVNPCP